LAKHPGARHHAHHAHVDAPYVTDFIQKLLPIAQQVKASWGVPVAVTIAQGALESGWGLRVVGNAYFGVKGKSPSGQSVNFATHEETSRGRVAINDNFRAYTSLQEAADDYGRLLRTNPRYERCFAFMNDPNGFADTLQALGYATDHKYARDLKSIIRQHHLAAYDQAAAPK